MTLYIWSVAYSPVRKKIEPVNKKLPILQSLQKTFLWNQPCYVSCFNFLGKRASINYVDRQWKREGYGLIKYQRCYIICSNINSGLNFEILVSYMAEVPDLLTVTLWTNFKIFSGFQNKEKLLYTWEHSNVRNENVNKFVVRISVG